MAGLHVVRVSWQSPSDPLKYLGEAVVGPVSVIAQTASSEPATVRSASCAAKADESRNAAGAHDAEREGEYALDNYGDSTGHVASRFQLSYRRGPDPYTAGCSGGGPDR